MWKARDTWQTPFGDTRRTITYYHSYANIINHSTTVPLRVIYEDVFCAYALIRANGHCQPEDEMRRVFIADYERWVLGLHDVDTRSLFSVPYTCEKDGSMW